MDELVWLVTVQPVISLSLVRVSYPVGADPLEDGPILSPQQWPIISVSWRRVVDDALKSSTLTVLMHIV